MDMTQSPTTQDVPGIISRGFKNFRRSLVPGTVMAVLVLTVAATFRLTAQSFVDSDQLLTAFLIDSAGAVVATVVALPWFHLAQSAEREQEISFPSLSGLHWGGMVAAALFFWGGVMFGIRYMAGLPSIFILIWYGLFGFALATGVSSGPKALGTSVRLGTGRRGTVALVAAILVFINILGVLPIGAGVNPLTIAATMILLVISTNVSMGAGAHLFDWLVRSEET